MVKEITLSEFSKLPLEERARLALKNFLNKGVEIKMENETGSLLGFKPFADA